MAGAGGFVAVVLAVSAVLSAGGAAADQRAPDARRAQEQARCREMADWTSGKGSAVLRVNGIGRPLEDQSLRLAVGGSRSGIVCVPADNARLNEVEAAARRAFATGRPMFVRFENGAFGEVREATAAEIAAVSPWTDPKAKAAPRPQAPAGTAAQPVAARPAAR